MTSKKKKLSLRDWERLNRGARPVSGYLRMRKDGQLATASPNAGTVGSAPTLDLDKKRPRDRIEVTKNAAYEAGIKLAIQTLGEMRTNEEAPGVTGRSYCHYMTSQHVTRRPGDQGGRGVPEWLRRLSQPAGQTVDTLPGDRPT
jgi:hypothetical protein